MLRRNLICRRGGGAKGHLGDFEVDPSSSPTAGEGSKRIRRYAVSVLAMHHIYHGEKKENILTWASSNHLRGLYLFGKPGRVVVEGLFRNVKTYEDKLCRLRWQKIRVMGRLLYDVPIVGEDEESLDDRGEPPYRGEGKHSYRWHFDGFDPVDNERAFCEMLEAVGLDEIVSMANRPFKAGAMMTAGTGTGMDGQQERRDPGGSTGGGESADPQHKNKKKQRYR